MIILGLTGSVGMGKSTTARQFRSLRVPVFDADAEIRQMREKDTSVRAALKKQLPQFFVRGKLDIPAMAKAAFDDSKIMKTLESIYYPVLRQRMFRFIDRHALLDMPLVVLDIPKLYESGLDDICDAVVVVTAPAFLQKQRVLRRAHMNERLFNQILARQMPDREKCAQADFVLTTGLGRGYTYRNVQKLVEGLR